MQANPTLQLIRLATHPTLTPISENTGFSENDFLMIEIINCVIVYLILLIKSLQFSLMKTELRESAFVSFRLILCLRLSWRLSFKGKPCLVSFISSASHKVKLEIWQSNCKDLALVKNLLFLPLSHVAGENIQANAAYFYLNIMWTECRYEWSTKISFFYPPCSRVLADLSVFCRRPSP